MDITGNLKVIGEVIQVSEKFKKRDVVLTDNSSQYPQHISFQLTQDKCGLLDKFKVGDEVKVHFNIRGKEYTNKEGKVSYFNSLEIWRVEGGVSNSAPAEKNEEELLPKGDDSDNLPF